MNYTEDMRNERESLPVDANATGVATQSALALWKKSILYTLFFLLLFFTLSVVGLGIFAYSKLLSFNHVAGTTTNELYGLLQTARQTTPQQTDGRENILILGTDALENREGQPQLTDTMILLSIDLNSGKVYSLSLPRDLWSEAYQTKINALYVYGADRYPQAPQQFPAEVLSELLTVPIHHTVVLSLDDLGQIIDAVGGVRIEVPKSFTDERFPRTDVDISSSDETELYETVHFEAGTEVMQSERALQYIRSRHAEGDEGSDVSRSKRQQQVISALVRQLTQPTFLLNTAASGNLFRLYHESFNQYIDLPELLATALTLFPHRQDFVIKSESLPIYPDEEAGVIEHPPVAQYAGQWVYSVRDLTLFHQEVSKRLEL